MLARPPPALIALFSKVAFVFSPEQCSTVLCGRGFHNSAVASEPRAHKGSQRALRTSASQVRCVGDRNHHQASRQFHNITPPLGVTQQGLTACQLAPADPWAGECAAPALSTASFASQQNDLLCLPMLERGLYAVPQEPLYLLASWVLCTPALADLSLYLCLPHNPQVDVQHQASSTAPCMKSWVACSWRASHRWVTLTKCTQHWTCG